MVRGRGTTIAGDAGDHPGEKARVRSMVQELSGFSSAVDRRKQLLALLAERKQVSVREVSDMLGVSEVTVRLDFGVLAREGLLQRLRGGATLLDYNKQEGTFTARLALQQAEKHAIATAAIDLVEDGETLLLDASTTVFELALLLREHKRNLHIITNGLYTALELSANPSFTVIVPGGTVRSTYGSLIGTLGEDALANLYTAKGFFSAQGIHMRQGLSESTVPEAQLKALMVEHTDNVIALLDSSKLGRTSFTSFCPLEKVGQVITSGHNAVERATPFIEHGLNVRVV